MAQEIQSDWFRDAFGESMGTPAEVPEKLLSTHFTTVECLWVQATREMCLVNRFFEQAKETSRAEKQALEQEISKTIESGREPSDDLFLSFPALEDFTWLSSEFAIIGLWRCVELFRTNAIKHALGDDDAIRCFLGRKKSKRPLFFDHQLFRDILSKLKIEASRIRCARSVDELRCLNNAIKHNQTVDGNLAEFPSGRKRRAMN